MRFVVFEKSGLFLESRKIEIGYEQIVESGGSGAKHRGDASSHLTVRLAPAGSWWAV